jgi:hypothetical protein
MQKIMENKYEYQSLFGKTGLFYISSRIGIEVLDI